MAIDLTPLAPLSFSQINFGSYIDQASTIDEKQTLTIKSTLKPTGTSSFVVRFDKSQNSSVAGAPDDVQTVYVVSRGDFRVYTPADYRAMVAQLNAVMSEANIIRLFRGEL